MDNVTHSLIGLVAGEAVASTRKKTRAPLWIASLLGNNIPDIDVPLGSLFLPDSLSRLLHHRGHTHTLALAPLQGLIIFLFIWAIYRRRQDFPWRETLFVSLLGPCLHILADSWNSYGVHPFWPLVNEWYYGDYVFILEPWIWIIAIPTLFFATTSRVLRAVFSLIVVGMLAALWGHQLVPAFVASILTACLVLSFLTHWRLRDPRFRVGIALGLLAFYLGAMAHVSHGLASRYSPQRGEIALSPFPGNPFCWSATIAEIKGEEYRATVQRLAPWPHLFPVQKCPAYYAAETNAPLQSVDEPFSLERSTRGVFTAPLAELRAIAETCRGNAFLRFARTPYWVKEGAGWQVGDLRFLRSRGRSFATVETTEPCVGSELPWIGRFHSEGKLLAPATALN